MGELDIAQLYAGGYGKAQKKSDFGTGRDTKFWQLGASGMI